MVDTFGAALKALREAAGMSLAGLAARTNFSKSALGHVETGFRTAKPDLAEACDRALSTTPLLSMLLDVVGGDDMKRRTLLGGITAVTSGGIVGASALADLLRHGFLDDACGGEDWEAVVDAHGRRLVVDPSPAFGAALLTQLLVLRHKVAEAPPTGRADLNRAAASLGQIYGLWLGNQGELSTAHNWYRTATALADRSGDMSLRTYVRGRSLARGIYEGYGLRQTLAGVDETLALTERPTAGAMEAHAARVHVHALTGDIKAGRAAVSDMRKVVDALPDEELRTLAGPVERTTFLNAFLECRVGDLAAAETACDQAFRTLGDWPLWMAETRVYLGRAMVASGNTAGGVRQALDAMRSMRHGVRVIGVAVRDVCSVVPRGYRSEEFDALRTYADPNPGPWELLVP